MYQQKQSLQEALLTLVQRLTTKEQIPSSEIMILTPFSHKKSLLKPGNLPHESGISWSNFTDHAHIETIHSAKGLERSVIILVELERRLTQGISVKDREKLLYVACSRACHHLIILLPNNTPEIVRRYFDHEEGNNM
jgi:superfamily I DNA/RNA helicase